ncbi:MAG: DUF2334 domain-containing protein [Persephonella sp.]|nr:DUF2334 domain-containing protein [Persephonella sp.]
MKNFNISIHDITRSNLQAVQEINSLLKHNNLEKISLLLIPKYHKREDIREIKDFLKNISKGKEIILHGYYHIEEKELNFLNRLFTSREGEVLSISLEEFEHRVKEGIKVLKLHRLKTKRVHSPCMADKKKAYKNFKKMWF